MSEFLLLVLATVAIVRYLALERGAYGVLASIRHLFRFSDAISCTVCLIPWTIVALFILKMFLRTQFQVFLTPIALIGAAVLILDARNIANGIYVQAKRRNDLFAAAYDLTEGNQ